MHIFDYCHAWLPKFTLAMLKISSNWRSHKLWLPKFRHPYVLKILVVMLNNLMKQLFDRILKIYIYSIKSQICTNKNGTIKIKMCCISDQAQVVTKLCEYHTCLIRSCPHTVTATHLRVQVVTAIWGTWTPVQTIAHTVTETVLELAIQLGLV